VADLPWLPGWLAAGIGSIESGLHWFNSTAAQWPIMLWVVVLLVYCYIASVLPVWALLQPRDYINSLQLISALGLIVVGLFVAAIAGGAPPVEGAARPTLEIVSPMWDFHPKDAPLIFPFLFITIACGAISGFHCLVSSGTSSKQLDKEPDARFVGYGSMLTEGFLATLVILACVAGLGLGIAAKDGTILTGHEAWSSRYTSWAAAGGLAQKVGAFVDGSANFLKAMGIPAGVAVALMGVLVASFAGTTLDTACRLQRYVIQELAATFAPSVSPTACGACGYDLEFNVSGKCPQCGTPIDHSRSRADHRAVTLNPITWLTNKHGATIAAVVIATAMAMVPPAAAPVSLGDAYRGAIPANLLPQGATEAPSGLAGLWWWSSTYGGKGGMILWPLFGATNQLLGGLSFLVIAFYLWRRKKPIFFLVIPLVFMLIMPAWAMFHQLFVGSEGQTAWVAAESKNWTLILIGLATLLLEAWMVVEAVLLFPKVKGVLEAPLPGVGASARRGESTVAEPAMAGADAGAGT
jgi:carbon starvation protein